jgi:MFS family permease
MWGIGNSLIGTAPTAYLTDITTAKNRSQALALFRSGGDLGLLLGAGLSGFMVGFMGVGPSIVLNASLLGLVVTIFHKRAVEPREIKQKEEQKN